MNIEEQIEKLSRETWILRKEMCIIRSLIKRQNEDLKNYIERQLLSRRVRLNGDISVGHFPIETQRDLDNLEQSISEENKLLLIAEAEAVLKNGGLPKCLHKILSTELILAYNANGTRKKRFLDYEKIVDVLCRATYTPGWHLASFHKNLRLGFKHAKAKYFKAKSAKKAYDALKEARET